MGIIPNFEKTVTTEKIVQPKETVHFYYEFAVLIIVVPAIMLLGMILAMKRKKPALPPSGKKSTPI